MKLFYRIFYSNFINTIYRSVLRPFRGVLPSSMKVPVTGIIPIKGDGKTILFYSNESCPMIKLLYWNDRGFTFEFSAIFKELAASADTFVDIGANVGYYSLLGTALNERLKVYAFEPSRGPLYFLKRNIELNGFESIHVIDSAVSDQTGHITFYEEKNLKYPYLEHHASGIGNTINSWGITNFEKYDVNAVTLDSIAKQEGFNTLDLIKMDTEGTEDRIIEGALETIREFQPIIICEVLPGEIGKRLHHLVKEVLGYQIYQFSGEQTLTVVEDLGKADKSHATNFFFVPAGKQHLISKFVDQPQTV